MSSVEGHLIHTYIHTCLHTYTHIPTKNYLSIFENHQNPWFWGAYPLRIWERSKTDPSPKRVFRRWLFPLRMNRKLRFFSNVSTMFCLEISSSNKCKSSKRNLATHRTRARVRKILTSIYGIGREGRPRLRRAARARARARARAKYPGFSKLVFFVV